MELGQKVQRLRKNQGLSQEQLAEQLGVSRQAVSKWELGESLPETENIRQLGRLFNVSADYLLNDDLDNDPRLPAPAPAKNKAAWWMLGLSLFAMLTMWVLSSVIYATKMVPDLHGPPMPVNEEQLSAEELQLIADMSTVQMYTSTRVRGDLYAFLETYNLRALFALCAIVALANAGLLLKKRRTR